MRRASRDARTTNGTLAWFVTAAKSPPPSGLQASLVGARALGGVSPYHNVITLRPRGVRNVCVEVGEPDANITGDERENKRVPRMHPVCGRALDCPSQCNAFSFLWSSRGSFISIESQAVAAPNGSGVALCGDRPAPPLRPCASLLPAASGVAGTGAIENEAQQQQQACAGTPLGEDKLPLEDSC
jgi:hypothetical protein